ncbi:MAG: serine/threonine-protein kinase [Gemmatimonadaceae bacterium]
MLDHEFIGLQQALAGEYSLERELGRGGMGIVYLAREVQLDRLVAIKVLPGTLAALPSVRERFLREARMAASLSHPHIVPIYRVGESDGFVFFVMAYVHGETLGERLRSRGPVSTAVGARLLREVTWALSYAHGRGIVHRDIKPDNILIEAETGRALVTDFGIALGAGANADEDGRIMGTAHFMSPEQAAGELIDGRSDLYSLGVVAHLALSGQLPSDTESSTGATQPAMEVATSVARVPAAPIPRALGAVIDRCLHSSPGARFASGEELADALEGASAPVRAKLPMALRVWTQAVDPLRPVYLAWSGVFTMGLLSELRGGLPTDILAIIAFGLLPLVPLSIFHARKTYLALSAGYTLRDLRAALSAWQNERREELAFELDETESTWAKAMRWVTYSLVGGVAFLFFDGMPHTLLAKIVTVSVIVGSIASVTASNALGVRMIARRVRPKLIGGIRAAMFNSRIGEWAVRLLTPRKRKSISAVDFRPTEMALGLAVDELFAALPKAYREHLAELPMVVRSLEAHAEAARARIDEIAALMSIGGNHSPAPQAANLVANRDAAKAELASSVAALEAVRLDLLRLHGGAGDLRPITTVLKAAKELGDELNRLGGAQREEDNVLRRPSFHLTPPTPV